MKDAFGHGSNSGGGSFADTLRSRLQEKSSMYGGPSFTKQPGSSNAEAAAALFSTLKSTMVPIHDSMAGRASNPTSGRSPAGLSDRISGVVTRGQSQGERINAAAWKGLK